LTVFWCISKWGGK